MKFKQDFASRFRILKGGKISLVVSALLVGNLMVGELNAASPVVTSTPTTNAIVGTEYSYTLTATDADNDSLTWSENSNQPLPSWLAISDVADYNITTVAGTGVSEYNDNNVSALSTNINPSSFAFDNNGVLYILDGVNSIVRKFDMTTGNIITVVGNGTNTYAGDDGLATEASLYGPRSIAFDSANNLYIMDFNGYRIRKVDATTNIVTTIAGGGSYQPNITEGSTIGTNTAPGFEYIVIDKDDNLYASSGYKDKVYKIDLSTNIITTYAGNGSETYGGDGGVATDASLADPAELAVDQDGNLYIADYGNNRIRKVDATTKIITTVAGNGSYEASFENGITATDANVYRPMRIAVDTNNNLFISSSTNNDVTKVNLTTNTITRITGTGSSGFSGDGGDAITAELYNPGAMIVDSSNSIYLADNGNARLRKLGFSSRTLLSGTPTINTATATENIALVVNDGTESVDHNFTISVSGLNLPATDINITSSSVNENVATGTVVGTLGAIDSDSANTAAFSLACSSAGSDDGSFEIVNDQLKITTVPDYETKTSYTVCVRATDADGENTTFDKNITIDVINLNDNEPTVTSTPITSVDLNSKYSYTLAATDEDGNQLSWSVNQDSTLPSWLTLEEASKVVSLGSTAISSGSVLSTSHSMDIDDSGIPYVAYYDSGITNQYNNSFYQAYVKKYVDGQWTTVGSAITTLKEYIHMKLDNNDVPYVIGQYKSATNGEKKATVLRFDGNWWQPVGSSSGFSAGQAESTSLAFDKENNLYTVYTDVANGSKATVMKFNSTNSTWETVGNAGFTSSYAIGTTIAFDNSTTPATPYITFQDAASGSKISVMRFDFTNSTWETVGNAGFSNNQAAYTTIDFDKNNTPFVAFKDTTTGRGSVMKYDTTDSTWKAVGEEFGTAIISNPSIHFNSQNTPYVSYDRGNTEGVFVEKFDGQDWVQVDQAYGAGQTYASGYMSHAIAIDKNDKIYLSYSDAESSYQMKAKKFELIDVLSGTPTSSNGAQSSENISLIVSDGVNSVDHNFTITISGFNNTPTDISLSTSSINENVSAGSVVGDLTATDADGSDTSTFSLGCSTVGTDDGSFEIVGNELKIKNSPDYETKNSYSVCIRVTDSGSATFDKNFIINIADTTAPTATITLNDSALSVGESATVAITFSENVTGFTVDDLTAQNGTFSNFAQSTTDSKVYTVTFTPTANTTATTNVITLANTYTDSATNTGTTATSGNYSVNTVASNTGGDNDNTGNPDDNNTGSGDTTTPTTPVDTTPPTATITLSDSTLTAGENAIVTITFSEEVKGLELSDFTVANGTLSNLAKSTTDAKVYTATFVPFINKSVNTNGIALKNSYTDMVNNTGTVSLSANYTINTYPAIDANKEAISKALQALVIPTNINWVTANANLTLPSTVTGSTATITWTSSKPTVVGTYGAVTDAGVVTQGSGADTYVILTATITSGSEITKKPFTIFVPKATATSTEQTKTIIEKISIADAIGTTQTATAITDDINVTAWTTNTPSGFTTTISSNNQTVIGTDGTVSRPSEDTPVTLTIKTCENGSTTNCTEKTITVVVKKEVENTNTAKLEEAKEILSSDIIANDNLNLNDITKDLTLPTTLGDATIVWTSSNEDVISDTGVIIPKGADVVVKLTATITVNGETITKDFIVKVPAVGGDVATKLAEAKTTTADLESKADTTTGTTRTSTIGFATSGGTVEQKVDIKTDIFTSDITTGTSGEVITTIAPKPSTTTTNQIQEIKVVQNPNGTSTNNVTIKDIEGNSKTTSLNFTPTSVNQEYKDDGSVEINIIPDVTTAKKSQILVNPNGTITNKILDDNNVALVSSTTQIQDASLFVSADGNVTIETIVATTLNNEDTTATVTTTSSSTKVDSSTKVGEAEVKSSADVTTGTTLSQNITSGGDVEITATNTAGGRSKKIKTTAQATTTHTVTNGSTETKATFDTAGLNITSNIGTDNITTKVETDQTSPSTTSALVGDELFEGVVITNDDGTSQTKFRITNTVTGAQRYVDSTVDTTTSLPQGTNSTIKLVDGKLVIENKQTTTSKTTLKIGASNDNN